MPNWKIIVISFLAILFLCKYYEFFYLYLPVRSLTKEGMSEQDIVSFTLFNFLFKVIFYFFKFATVSIILLAGIFLEGKKNKNEMASLKDIFILVMVAEFIFFGEDIIKIINFSFINPGYTMEDYQNFHPLSLFNLLEAESGSNYAYALQTVSLFELGYIICLIIGLKKLQYPNDLKAVSVTLSSYGGGLLIWVLIVTFFTLL